MFVRYTLEAQEFLESMVFWDEKRPITVELLKRVDISKLAKLLGQIHIPSEARRNIGVYESRKALQMTLFK